MRFRVELSAQGSIHINGKMQIIVLTVVDDDKHQKQKKIAEKPVASTIAVRNTAYYF